jgi:hypothetical protein
MPFRELKADLWSGIKPGNAVAVTTNGVLTKDGRSVMGKGTALQARNRYPGIDQRFGDMITRHGNHCIALRMEDTWHLVSFPTKHHWREKSDLDLIERSAVELVILADGINQWKEIYLPRPGTANGGLSWLEVVTSGALDHLDERFIVVYQ